ncbi:MAG TPA: RDD family protein [Chthoniobacteraceae bacterium]|nr:RDD family protein [Chthoniobacteraceae bacterium]
MAYQTEIAKDDFKDAEKILWDIHQNYPQWNPSLVQDRQRRIDLALDVIDRDPNRWFMEKYGLKVAARDGEGPKGRLEWLENISKKFHLNAIPESSFITRCMAQALFAMILLLTWVRTRKRILPFSKRYRTIWARYCAVMFDASLFWLLDVQANLYFAGHQSRRMGYLADLTEIMAVLMIYIVVMHAKYGRTLGERIFNLRVVDVRTLGPISTKQAVVRLFVFALPTFGVLLSVLACLILVQDYADDVRSVAPLALFILDIKDWLLGFWLALAVLLLLCSRRRRLLHDFAAGTVMVRTNVSDAIAEAPVIAAVRSKRILQRPASYDY